MTWMMQAVDGINFDKKTRWLMTNEGDPIASLHIQPDGKLEIGQGMDTNFQFQNGRVHRGWTCEEHICSGVTLESEGGTLDYQKGRCLFQESTPIKIGIAITEGGREGFIAISPPPARQFSRFFQRIFGFL